VINLKAINRTFTVGDERVYGLRDVDLTIMTGEYVAVMGPSGSGKSTLLNIIGLLDRPDSGEYRLEGDNMNALNDRLQAHLRRHKIGFIFQFFHLVPRMTAAENIALPMVLAGVEPKERRQRMESAVETFGLKDRAGHRPDQLSGGQRQRVAIARATIMKPHILLADEPTGNLDRTSGSEVIEILEEINSRNITLIMVTHDPELGNRARRKIQLMDGRISMDSSSSPAAQHAAR
jgi:putative ABC transport system ATP-binding protein